MEQDYRDEHTLFCLSLVPKLRRLTQEQYENVQIKILQSIREETQPKPFARTSSSMPAPSSTPPPPSMPAPSSRSAPSTQMPNYQNPSYESFATTFAQALTGINYDDSYN